MNLPMLGPLVMCAFSLMCSVRALIAFDRDRRHISLPPKRKPVPCKPVALWDSRIGEFRYFNGE